VNIIKWVVQNDCQKNSITNISTLEKCIQGAGYSEILFSKIVNYITKYKT
jgi:hypothetical protein